MDRYGLDPELRYQVLHDGIFLLRVLAFPDAPNSTIAYAGGEKFVYRLAVSNGPTLERTAPAALSRKHENHLQGLGFNLAKDPPLLILPAATANASSSFVAMPGVHGLVELPIYDEAVMIESEPNSKTQPQAIPEPVVVTGLIDSQEDQDVFLFSSDQGQRWRISVEAQSWGSSLDAVLAIADTEGKQLATNDDTGQNRDPSLSFAAPAVGNYVITVSDMFGTGGSHHWYRLKVLAEAADYSLSTASDLISGKVNQPIELSVNVVRELDFAADIAVGLLSAERDLGVAEVISKKSDDGAKVVKLKIQSDQPFSGPVRIQGQVAKDEKRTRWARPTAAASDWLWLTVSP